MSKQIPASQRFRSGDVQRCVSCLFFYPFEACFFIVLRRILLENTEKKAVNKPKLKKYDKMGAYWAFAVKPEYWGKILNREKNVEFRLLNQYCFEKVVLSGELQTKLAIFKSKEWCSGNATALLCYSPGFESWRSQSDPDFGVEAPSPLPLSPLAISLANPWRRPRGVALDLVLNSLWLV